MRWFDLAVFSGIAYLVGAIPFSYIITKALKGIDLREFGSGNLGSTNTIRALGLKAGLVVQSLDILKGWLPVALVQFTFSGPRPFLYMIERDLYWAKMLPIPLEVGLLVVGICAILGHMFPVYLKFHGGKGVNTSMGVFLALAPKALLATLAISLTLLAITRIVSLCSMVGSVVLVFASWYFYPDNTALITVTVLLSALVIFMHRSNIKRLLAGAELRIGKVDIKGELNEGTDEEPEA